jgi:hypothetical protein
MRKNRRGESERTIFEATPLQLRRKLENNLAAALAARRMRNGRFRFAQWISLLYFRL